MIICGPQSLRLFFMFSSVILINGKAFEDANKTEAKMQNLIADSQAAINTKPTVYNLQHTPSKQQARQSAAATTVETSTPNFVRLVVMRLIYGIASTMGLEDRLEGAFNGVFVPPNADEDVFGIGSEFSDGDDGGIADIFDDGF